MKEMNKILSLMERVNKNQFTLLENRESDAKKRCYKVIIDHFHDGSWLYREFVHPDNPEHMTSLDYMFYHFEEEFFHDSKLRARKVMRLEPMICRIAFQYNFQNNNPNNVVLSRLKKFVFILDRLGETGKINTAKIDINTTTYEDLNEKMGIGKLLDDSRVAMRSEVNSTNFKRNENYKIFGPLTYEEAHEIGNYSSPNGKLCHTQSKSTWDSYTADDSYNAYVALIDGWKDIEPVHDDEEEKSPYDTYGLSMIFVFVDDDGNITCCNTRWNHNANYEGEHSVDYALNEVEVSKILGVNFYKTFLPKEKSEDLSVEEYQQRLENGENPRNLFDRVYRFVNGFARVCVGENNWNYIDRNNMLLCEEWFSQACDFDTYGKARVNVKGEGWNVINSEGQEICQKYYLDIHEFDEHGLAAVVTAEDGWNLINLQGSEICQMYFSKVYPFNEFDVAKVWHHRNGFNVINTNGDLICQRWYKKMYSFDYNGIAEVQIETDESNIVTLYIDTEGNEYEEYPN